MPPSLTPPATGVPTAEGPGHHPRAAWAMALAGAGGVATVLALVPGMGIYLAIVVVPILYVLGVPLAVRAFTATTNPWRQARRLVGGGAAIGALVPTVPFTFGLLGVHEPGRVLLGPILLCAVAGAIVSAIALAVASVTPPRRRTIVAAVGPTLLLLSAAVQVALFF